MNEILACLEEGYATAPDLATRLGWPNTTTRDRLHKLESQGLVERVQKHNSVFWRLTHASAPASDGGDGNTSDDVDNAIGEIGAKIGNDKLRLIDELRTIELRRIEILEQLK